MATIRDKRVRANWKVVCKIAWYKESLRSMAQMDRMYRELVRQDGFSQQVPNEFRHALLELKKRCLHLDRKGRSSVVNGKCEYCDSEVANDAAR